MPVARPELLDRLRRQRCLERICCTPRLVAELLEEIGRVYGIAAEIDRRIARYAALDPELLHALGGDRFPSTPLRIVAGRR